MQENLIKSVWIDEKTDEPTPWIIDGLVCPWLTLLSGQPKHGKTTLAGHIVNSLLNGTTLFNKEASQGAHKVAWMGYDGGWKEELRERLETSANRNIILYDPIRSLDDSLWWQLALDMKAKIKLGMGKIHRQGEKDQVYILKRSGYISLECYAPTP
jgi:hypothetical protein